MPKNMCIFQAKWLDDPRYSQWLKKKNDEVALCSYCKKEINIGNMGETAFTSYLKGKKHQEISKFSCTDPITSLLKRPSETENKSQDNMPQTSKRQVGIDNLMVGNATTKAEIRWVLNMVCLRYSKNSSSNVNVLFAAMFPDRLILYWDNDTDRVCTRYMGSEFMGRSTADDVLETFQNGISEVDESKVMQVSSNGPKFNLAFLKKYASVREEKELAPLKDLGTCGLHALHGSIKAGAKASEWELQKLLKAMWQFILDAPARRAMYENISESTDYPAKFCGHRRYENEKCAEKAESLIKG